MRSRLVATELGRIATRPGLSVHLLSATGETLQAVGDTASSERFVVDGERVVPARLPAGREFRSQSIEGHPGDSQHLIGCWPAGEASLWQGAFESMVSVLRLTSEAQYENDNMSHHLAQVFEEVCTFMEVSQQLPACADAFEMAKLALTALMVATGARRGVCALCDETQSSYRIVTSMESGGKAAGGGAADAEDPTFTVEEGLIGKVIQGGHGAYLNDLASSEVALTRIEALAERNLLVAPMPLVTSRGSQILGAICLMDRAERGMSTGAEFTSSEQRLADAIGVLVGSFIGTTQLAELRKELEVGRTIQNALLPAESPRVAGFDIAGKYRQARHVGGDYFDFIRAEDDTLVTVIADVSGHNLASGMMMVMARALLRSIASKNLGAAEILAQLSSGLFQDLMRNERFITAFLVRLRDGERILEYANAGHNAPVVWRSRQAKFETLDADGTLVGFIADQQFEQRTTRMEPGDILVLYTDGITEATAANGEMFGEQRLTSVVAGARFSSAQEILDRIFKAVADFADGEGDDVTAVVIRAVAESRGELGAQP